MITRTPFILIALVIVIALASLLPLKVATGQAGQAGPGEPSAASLVIAAGTQATIRREGWSNFSRLSLGADVQFGDLLDPQGEPLRILCPNLAVQVMTHLGPLPCPRERVILHLETGAVAGWQRGSAEDPAIPFLISPRATVVATPYPLIWWRPVADADGYRVTVRGERLDWSVTVNDPHADRLVYPSTAPALEPGAAYTVEIVTIMSGVTGRSSIEENVPGLSFSILPADAIDQVHKTAASIRANIRDAALGDLAVAYFYAQQNLNAEALPLLVGITTAVSGLELPGAVHPVSPVSASPVPYLRLGNLLANSRLGIYAESAYLRAAELAEKSGDLESQADAWVELARLAATTNERTQDATKAVTLWQQLGAQQQSDAVQKEFELGVNF